MLTAFTLFVRAHARAVLVAGIVLLIAAGVVLWRRPDPAPLPAALAATVERHALATAVDTAEIHRLTAVADTARAAQRRDSVRAARLEASAAVEHYRADSLADAAALASSARDSATAYHAAYDARTLEADTLRTALVVANGEVVQATARGDALAIALNRSELRGNRADSVIAAAVKVVQESDPPCRLLRFFSCPSRGVAVLGGALLGAAAGIAVSKR